MNQWSNGMFKGSLTLPIVWFAIHVTTFRASMLTTSLAIGRDLIGKCADKINIKLVAHRATREFILDFLKRINQIKY